MKRLKQVLNWIWIAFVLFVALDNLIFQPPWPGIFIGGVILLLAAQSLYQAKKRRKGEKDDGN